ncbi:MAG: RecX family transcriptional regulator [bacterium]
MKITKIEKQKKDKHRYNIFLDGEFSFGLYEDTVLKFGLRTDDEIDEKRTEELKEFDEYNFGKKVAYSFLAYKQRSIKELKNKLKLKKISEEAIEKIITLLTEQKYLDDKSYAKNYLDDKLARKPVGKRLLKLKLMEKGIDKETVESTVIDNYSESKEEELAVQLIKKYKQRLKGKDESEVRNKCYRYLASKGYDYDVISKVMKFEDE